MPWDLDFLGAFNLVFRLDAILALKLNAPSACSTIRMIKKLCAVIRKSETTCIGK